MSITAARMNLSKYINKVCTLKVMEKFKKGEKKVWRRSEVTNFSDIDDEGLRLSFFTTEENVIQKSLKTEKDCEIGSLCNLIDGIHSIIFPPICTHSINNVSLLVAFA